MLMFDPIEPVDEDLNRVLVSTEEESALDPDLNYFLLAKDPGLLDGKGSVISLLTSMASRTYDCLQRRPRESHSSEYSTHRQISILPIQTFKLVLRDIDGSRDPKNRKA